jgi:hypothetical protein
MNLKYHFLQLENKTGFKQQSLVSCLVTELSSKADPFLEQKYIWRAWGFQH